MKLSWKHLYVLYNAYDVIHFMTNGAQLALTVNLVHLLPQSYDDFIHLASEGNEDSVNLSVLEAVGEGGIEGEAQEGYEDLKRGSNGVCFFLGKVANDICNLGVLLLISSLHV